MNQVQNELTHYGVMGMRWGKSAARSPKAQQRADNKANAKADRQIKSSRRKDVKNRRVLSDRDLSDKIGRLEKEKKLRDLTDSDLNSGRKAAGDIMKSAGTRVATTMLTGASLYAVKSALTGKVDLGDLAGYVAPKPGKK